MHIQTLYMSLTNRCNLHCEYCSAEISPSNNRVLPLDLAKQRLTEWISLNSQAKLLLVLTGGEPTMVGMPYLQQACEHAQSIAHEYAKKLKIGIQTNGTCIKQEFVEWAVEFNVAPSISFDGLISLQDQLRGKSSEKILNGLTLLQQAGLDFGVICCMSREVAQNIRQVLAFMEEHDFHKIRINSLGIWQVNQKWAPDAQRLAEAWIAIHQHMKINKNSLQELNVSNMVRSFKEGKRYKKTMCRQFRCGAGEFTANVNPDAQLTMCVERSLSGGFEAVQNWLDLQGQIKSLWKENKLWAECKQCFASCMCDYGCHAYHKFDRKLIINECEARQKFWKHLVLNEAAR